MGTFGAAAGVPAAHLSWRRPAQRIAAAVLLATVAVGGLPAAAQAAPNPVFPIANQAFWDYFQHRGGIQALGQPVSQQFTLGGRPSQLFQRALLQLDATGKVQLHNVLDDLPSVRHVGGLSLPAVDPSLTAAAPTAGSPDYAAQMLAFLRQQVPDTFEGQPVNFLQTYLSTVPLSSAFPGQQPDPSLQLLLGLELWGVPTSHPVRDPNNHDFVYQRFQRGIMHYQAHQQITEGLLVGDWLKALLTGQSLPPDLAAETAGSALFEQYDPSTNRGPVRTQDLPGTSLDGAFAPGITGDPRYGVVMAGPSTDDPHYVAAALQALHAGSWYSFGGADMGLPGEMAVIRPGTDMGQLAARVQANPGQAWLIGNEPNVPGQDDLTPGQYADFLHQAAQTIKAADPAAQLVGPNVLNWDRTCGGCGGGLRASGHAWSDAFLTTYRQRYGPVPLDAWGIHTYTLDWDHLPMIDAAANEADLAAARSWLAASGLTASLWLTEFGVVWAYGGKQQLASGKFAPVGPYRDDLVNAYIDSTTSWLAAPGSGVSRWLLYASTPPPEPYATGAAGVALLQPGSLTLTSAGQRYRAAAVKPAG